ncbi:hypothetical protein [Calycomorphotria hydatis]|uniref:Uncharacterized protein n=1 Tax=Calycomorphotria hydatis TaxID=2528027 RepID=A0A517TDY9_9PLAN|nr:hypothetical protein [Calycomorphotria hydatis]QDT66585.1 hypothetical protein V22_38550 [Calycomorphotria hydatis]
MAITYEQLDQFHQFASDQLKRTSNKISWPELFELWRLENPSVDEQTEIYAALDESWEDIQQGRHRPADDVISDLRNKLVTDR